MILVTGAAGKTGRAIVRRLSGQGVDVRVVVRREEQVEQLLQRGAREVVIGDLLDEAALTGAMRAVAGVVHVCPNIHPDEIAIGRLCAATASSQGVGRFVFHSVLHPQTEAMAHHWRKMRVEELLLESGLHCTVLQPAPYMQNVLAQWDRVVAGKSFPVPYAATTRTALVDLEDVAEAVAVVLSKDEHVGATYQLCGERSVTVLEIVAALERRLGRPVELDAQSPRAWAESAAAEGLTVYQRETLTAMFRYYEEYGLIGGTSTLAWLLGRPPTTLDEMLARIPGECLQT